MGWRQVLAMGVAMGLAGCAVEANPARGDLTLNWTFAGARCGEAGVSTVNVRLFDPGGTELVNDAFPCSQGAADYTALALGDYGYVVDGFDTAGTRLYEASGSVGVREGANIRNLDLTIPQ